MSSRENPAHTPLSTPRSVLSGRSCPRSTRCRSDGSCLPCRPWECGSYEGFDDATAWCAVADADPGDWLPDSDHTAPWSRHPRPVPHRHVGRQTPAAGPLHRSGEPASETGLGDLVALVPLPSKVPVTWTPKSELRSWFPPDVRVQHGPPSLHRVRVPSRSPTSSLLRSPPTPLLRRPPLRVPSRLPTTARTPVLDRPRVRPQTHGALEISVPAPRTAFHRRETGASQVTGPSSSRVPWSFTPRRCAAASPLRGDDAAAFGQSGALGYPGVN